MDRRIVSPVGIKAFVGRFSSVIASSPGLLRFAFKLLRRFRPIFVVRKSVIVSRHDDVVEVLKRDQEFTIAEINQEHMDRAPRSFYLGMGSFSTV